MQTIPNTATNPRAQGLREVGRTFNTEYYVRDPDMLFVFPTHNLKDNADSARINIEFQSSYAKSVGHPCAVIVLLGRLLSQDSAARRVYAQGMDPKLFFAASLVVSSPISQAIGSFFIGLSRPPIPTRIFDSLEAAESWAKSQRPRPEGP